jgi:SRR1 domain
MNTLSVSQPKMNERVSGVSTQLLHKIIHSMAEWQSPSGGKHRGRRRRRRQGPQHDAPFDHSVSEADGFTPDSLRTAITGAEEAERAQFGGGSDAADVERRAGLCARRVAERQAEILASEWYGHVREHMLRVVESRLRGAVADAAPAAVCVALFGVGNLLASRSSQFQFALVNLLLESVRELHPDGTSEGGEGPQLAVSAVAYDPLMTRSERLAVSRLTDWRVLGHEENREGAWTTDGVLVLYLPHCPVAMTENAVRANWSPVSRLSRLVLLCNGIADLCDRRVGVSASNDVCCALAQAPGFLVEHRLDDDGEFREDPSAFSDTSLHTFAAAAAGLPLLPCAFLGGAKKHGELVTRECSDDLLGAHNVAAGHEGEEEEEGL